MYPSVDALLWGTGAVVWGFLGVLFVFVILPAAPALLIIGLKHPFQMAASRLDSRYYDGPEDVKTARSNGTWYYYLIHYLFVVDEAGNNAAEWWFRLAGPYYDRLPLGRR